MPKSRLWWHLLPSYALAVLAALVGFGWLAIHEIERSLVDAARDDLVARADLLERQIGAEGIESVPSFAAIVRQFNQSGSVRVAVLLPDGQPDPDFVDHGEPVVDTLARREVRQATSGATADEIRYNAALDEQVLYVAVPAFRNDQVFRVLYFSKALPALDEARWHVQLGLAAMGLPIVGLAALLARRAARGVAQSADSVRRATDRLADDQWNARATVPEPRELADLAESVNRLADRLQQRLGVLTRNNNEQKAVLASMSEGVLAVDSQERVISLNTAASSSLSIDPSMAQGRPLREVVRNADLSRFITRALAGQESIEADILLHGDRERTMQARGSVLHDLDGRAIGVVVVLNDVTAFRRLEHIRRDFVANVSHELKTPITSIKGFVETLLDGAMSDPTDAQRFLRIIAKQADRLHAIIEDLLALSKIEQTEEQEVVLARGPIRPVVESAVSACQTAAAEREIPVVVECPDDLQAAINPVLLEQAVVNLLDNAIKYSNPGREVRLAAAQRDGQVTISIADRGCGIASLHLERVFERFYRVDPARSRKLGGTGLGLAIVKHIVQAHRGRVDVESTLGVGSTFTITLPA